MMKAKNMMYMQYMEHLPFKSMDDLIINIKMTLKPLKYAAILHDKDTNEEGSLKKPHIHVMLQFENARSINSIAKLLNEKPQYIEKWDGDSNIGYAYLVHATASSSSQYQYSSEEVIANFDFQNLIQSIKKHTNLNSKRLERITDIYLDLLYVGKMTREAIEQELTGSQYAKLRTKIDSVYQKFVERKANMWREKMKENNQEVEVIWIHGDSGKGKTRLAKSYGDSLTNKVYISGSSRDPFQRYQLESVIILDELRSDTFEYADLLKMLDPFNDEAMGASRYFDKPLLAETIIITSPYSPQSFYSKLCKENKRIDSNIDSFQQLARRLGLVMKLTTQYLDVEFYNEKEQKFIIDKSAREPNPYLNEQFNTNKSSNNRTEKLLKNVIDSLSKEEKPAIEPTKANDDELSTAKQLSLELSHEKKEKESSGNNEQDNL